MFCERRIAGVAPSNFWSYWATRTIRRRPEVLAYGGYDYKSGSTAKRGAGAGIRSGHRAVRRHHDRGRVHDRLGNFYCRGGHFAPDGVVWRITADLDHHWIIDGFGGALIRRVGGAVSARGRTIHLFEGSVFA